MLFIVLFPVVFFVILELVLRYFQYGGNLDLVVKTTMLGKEYYTLNRDVAKRYFSQKGVAVPEAYDDLFEIKKQPNTKRVFMLGESTMAGFPYEYNATAPRLLQDRLKQLLPQFNIEVINVGLSAVNSYTVLDFEKELTAYEPDAFVVYVGHNEFYGAMGVGSTEYLGQWRWMINLYLEMRQFRLFLLMRDAMIGVRNIFHSDVASPQSSLMEMMVRDKTIPYNSDSYKIARKNFEANLREIISISKDNHIPLVVSTLTSNLRDQKPFLSIFSEQTTEQMKQQWQAAMNEGNASLKKGELPPAIESYKKAIDIDSLQADAHYALAQAFDQLHDTVSAKREFERASDFDGLRFRATNEFNSLIKTVCNETNVPIVDAEKVFNEQSPEGIVGHNLILEHLHPNFDGYSLLAKTFFQAIADNDVLVPRKDFHWDKELTDEKFKELSGVTSFDLEGANYRIFELMHRWPFVQTDEVKAAYPIKNKVADLAVACAKKRLAWSKARTQLAQWYDKNGEYANAEKEYYAQSKVMWYYYLPFMYMGDMYRNMNDSVKTEESYFKALATENSPFVHVRLGMFYYDKHNTDKSIEHFEDVFSNEQSIVSMSAEDRSLARYFLAAAYWAKQNKEKTVSNLQLALQLDPKNSDAKQLLNMIPH